MAIHVIATAPGSYKGDRIRVGRKFFVDSEKELGKWMERLPEESVGEAAAVGVDEPTTLGALAAPAVDLETGKAAATLPAGTVVVNPPGKKRPRPALAPAPVDDLTD